MNSNYLILYLHVYWLLLELAIKFCWEQCYASCSKLAGWHTITCNIVKQFVLVNLHCSYCDNISQMMRLNCPEMSFSKDPETKDKKQDSKRNLILTRTPGICLGSGDWMNSETSCIWSKEITNITLYSWIETKRKSTQFC